MDSHPAVLYYPCSHFLLNTYFNSEVDAALYSRALESIDSAVAKKTSVDLGILPSALYALCHTWFTRLFVGTLPPDCVNRVWDNFLYEGILFLLRVALSLTTIRRKFILSATPCSESQVLATLARPPPQWLPPTADSFLSLTFGKMMISESR